MSGGMEECWRQEHEKHKDLDTERRREYDILMARLRREFMNKAEALFDEFIDVQELYLDDWRKLYK